jgi:hypothetical protein
MLYSRLDRITVTLKFGICADSYLQFYRLSLSEKALNRRATHFLVPCFHETAAAAPVCKTLLIVPRI